MLRQLPPRLDRKLRPQAWRHALGSAGFRPAPGAPASVRGVVRRPRNPHASKPAQHGRDSPKAGACAPKCVPGDARRATDLRLPWQGPSQNGKSRAPGRPEAERRSAQARDPNDGD